MWHISIFFLKTILNEIPIGILLIDRSGKIILANSSVFNLLDNFKKSLKNIFFLESYPELLNGINLFLKNKEERKIQIKGKDNTTIDVQLKSINSGNDKGVLIFFRDVTEEKKIEEIKRDLVANVSHELRTPLASIKGYAETLMSDSLKDKITAKKFISVIYKHSVRMSSLIEDLLTLSMLESSQVKMNFSKHDITSIIRNVIHGMKKQAMDKRLKLEMEIQENLPKITIDSVRIEQVLVNLIDNAIKYTNKGSVNVRAYLKDNNLIVEVSDTGIGIPEKDLTRIFERFYRVDKGRSRELGGTGLGLSIVKHIIQAHSGNIWVKSKVGKGSTFAFSIPLRT